MPFKPCRNLSCLLLIIQFSFLACSNQNKAELGILKTLTESLQSSNNIINKSTVSELKKLTDKSTDYVTSARANIWLPKAELIALFTKIRFNFIEEKIKDNKFSDKDINEVYYNLSEYKKEVLGRDSSIEEQFQDEFQFIKTFLSTICTDTSIANIKVNKKLKSPNLKAALISLQNEIKKTENKIITYCNNKVTNTIFNFDTYSVIVGQNSSYLKPGELLEINAGVGAFSKSSNPKIKINGNNVILQDEGYASFKIKVQRKSGNYRIPVNFDYFDQSLGKDISKLIFVEYTVAKECDQ